MAANVSLRNVVKRFGSSNVVNDVSLEIKAGEFVVLVGPSGCGKSTTLRMVAGLEQISAGEIAIDGRVVNHLAPKDRGVAMVFQNYALYPHLTVRDNISFGLRLGRTPKPEIEAAVANAAEILELGKLLDRQPAELSGGQRQRVAMGRAIVRNPSVFLFDEPLSNLDAKLRTQMRTEIKRLHARLKNTIIYVTHDQLEAMTLADRIVVMRNGVIEQMGTPAELFDAPVSSFVAGFIGSPPMNLVPGKLSRHEGSPLVSFDESTSVRLAAAALGNGVKDGPVLFGIRPEDVHLDGQHNTQSIQGHVELVEPLGSESFVHVRVGNDQLIVRVDGRRTVRVDQHITLHLDVQRVCLFDTETDRCVYREVVVTQ